MIEIILSDRVGRRVKVPCDEQGSVADLKALVAAQMGTKADRIRLQRGPEILRDAVPLDDYEIMDGTVLDLYYE
jgi:ubiquitin-like protein 5